MYLSTLDLSTSACLHHIVQHSYSTQSGLRQSFPRPPMSCPLSLNPLLRLPSSSFVVGLFFFCRPSESNLAPVRPVDCPPFCVCAPSISSGFDSVEFPQLHPLPRIFLTSSIIKSSFGFGRGDSQYFFFFFFFLQTCLCFS